MPGPLNIAISNYHEKPKSSTIYTPVPVAKFLFDILKNGHRRWVDEHVREAGLNYDRPKTWMSVFDPAIGTGRLTDPWRAPGRTIIGCDVDNQGADCDFFIHGRFEDQLPNPGPIPSTILNAPFGRPDLIVCNPPFNGASGRRLYPEVFLEQIFKLFGPTISTAMFVPMGLRLNQRRISKRFRWMRDCGAEITSIISLPIDLFDNAQVQNEIVIFNVEGIKPHYWLTEEAL